MKQNYSHLRHCGFSVKKFRMSVLFLTCILTAPLIAQTRQTFVSAGATRASGLTQRQINTACASTNPDDLVTVNPDMQSFTAAATGIYRVMGSCA